MFAAHKKKTPEQRRRQAQSPCSKQQHKTKNAKHIRDIVACGVAAYANATDTAIKQTVIQNDAMQTCPDSASNSNISATIMFRKPQSTRQPPNT